MFTYNVLARIFSRFHHSVLTFGSYETYKKSLLERFPNVRPIFMYALAAVMGDLTGSGVLCPSEVVKQKMQAGMYKTTGEAYSNIWKSNGLLGFYEGYLGGITRDVPFRVAQLTSYELTKNLYLRIKKRRQGGRKRTSTRLELTPTEGTPLVFCLRRENLVLLFLKDAFFFHSLSSSCNMWRSCRNLLGGNYFPS